MADTLPGVYISLDISIFRENYSTTSEVHQIKVSSYCMWFAQIITITRLFKYIENFTSINWKYLDKKNSDIFHISAQNINCGYSLEPSRRGGSNEYPQSMFSSKNKKYNVYPCKPQFYYIKVGFKGVKIIWACFSDVQIILCMQILVHVHVFLLTGAGIAKFSFFGGCKIFNIFE